MVLRITVYGIAKPNDSTYALVDMVYFLEGDQYITVSDVMNAIKGYGYQFVPLRYSDDHPLHGQVVRDKVTIEDVTIGMEPIEQEQLDYQQGYQQQYPY
jgi:hypothetical protein